MSIILLKKRTSDKAKKINPMSQSCHARLCFSACLIQQNSRFFFFCLLDFLFQFLWTCLSKYTWKNVTDTIKHFEQQTSSTLCSVLYLVHPKIKFHISYWTNCDRLKPAAQGKKKKKKHSGQVFQFVTSFETNNFFFLSLTEVSGYESSRCEWLDYMALII